MEGKSDLERLKENYKQIQEKYNLPEFSELNENFHIEKIAENETELLIKEVKRFVSDKISNYLRFIEALLNPMHAQMFVFSMIKSLSPEEKEKITEIYKKLSKIEVEFIKSDISFSEERDAEFVKKTYKAWEEIKEQLIKIIENIEKNWDTKAEGTGKAYFG